MINAARDLKQDLDRDIKRKDPIALARILSSEEFKTHLPPLDGFVLRIVVSENACTLIPVLKECGVDLNALLDINKPVTALAFVAQRGSIGLIEALLENGADINLGSPSPLEVAVTHLRAKAVSLFLSYGPVLGKAFQIAAIVNPSHNHMVRINAFERMAERIETLAAFLSPDVMQHYEKELNFEATILTLISRMGTQDKLIFDRNDLFDQYPDSLNFVLLAILMDYAANNLQTIVERLAEKNLYVIVAHAIPHIPQHQMQELLTKIIENQDVSAAFSKQIIDDYFSFLPKPINPDKLDLLFYIYNPTLCDVYPSAIPTITQQCGTAEIQERVLKVLDKPNIFPPVLSQVILMLRRTAFDLKFENERKQNLLHFVHMIFNHSLPQLLPRANSRELIKQYIELMVFLATKGVNPHARDVYDRTPADWLVNISLMPDSKWVMQELDKVKEQYAYRTYMNQVLLVMRMFCLPNASAFGRGLKSLPSDLIYIIFAYLRADIAPATEKAVIADTMRLFAKVKALPKREAAEITKPAP